MRHVSGVIVLLSLIMLTAGCGRKTSTSPEDKSPSKAGVLTHQRPDLPVSPKYRSALQARVGDEYVVVILAEGQKAIVPLETLEPGDLEWLTALAERSPFVTSGKSSVVVVESTDPTDQPKKTIEVSMKEGPVETVQLCSPNVSHDQIGATCMLYARVHWLDIAGFYVERTEIYKIINDTPPETPWTNPKYVKGLESIMTGFRKETITHRRPPGVEPFEWARDELRRGRPLLAALTREIWVALPVDYLAERIWSGGSIGHQIVVNGFTWNSETGQGTFHVVNSWSELTEFDLSTRDASDGILLFEASLSPLGERQPKEDPAVVQSRRTVETVRFLKSVGSTNLYEVRTRAGVHKIAAPDAEAARRMIEEGS